MTEQNLSLEEAITLAKKVEKWEYSADLTDNLYNLEGNIGELNIELCCSYFLSLLPPEYHLRIYRKNKDCPAKNTKVYSSFSLWFGKIGKLYKEIENEREKKHIENGKKAHERYIENTIKNTEYARGLLKKQ